MSNFCILLATLLMLTPSSASADPVTLALTQATAWFTGLGVFGKAAVQLGLSALLNFGAAALLPTPNAKRELTIPRSRPPKRFVYGRVRVYGSPAPWRVKRKVLYGCLLLNSRPSAGGTVQVYFDKRAATIETGDVYDFDGAGGYLSIEDFPDFRSGGDLTDSAPRIWIGRGDQSGPPAAILAEAGDLFRSTDAWTGRTVMWVRLVIGPKDKRAKRWRATPPDIEVEADWSRVYDPRDEDQDPDDASTWTYSNNQALCALDALRTNPIRQYPLDQIHLESFIEAADDADDSIARFYAGTPESRYTVNGIIIWRGGELADQIAPLAAAGAGSFARIAGRVGFVSGVYRTPLLTVTDFIESGGIDFSVLRPARETPAFVKVVYIDPARDWQESELPPLAVPGVTFGTGEEAVQEVRLDFCTSPTQAMRVQKILALRIAAQKRLSVVLWPDAMNLVAGAGFLTNFPTPLTRLNGEWVVEAADPAVWLSSDPDEIALRVPVAGRENSAGIYAWTPATDEIEQVSALFDPTVPDSSAPDEIFVATGDGVSIRNVLRIKFSFDPVEDIDEYEWEYRADSDPWLSGGFLGGEQLDDLDRVFAVIDVSPGIDYVFRVRSVISRTTRNQEVSDWVESAPVRALPTGIDLAPPESGTATGGAGQITAQFTAPNSADYLGVEFWGSSTDVVGDAILLGTVFGAQNTVAAYVETGLGSAETRYYFARSVGDFDTRSSFTASVNATTDP